MSFVSNDVLEQLGDLSREEADNQPFGIVKADNEGRILLYNKYESELEKIAVNEAEGKIYFTEVAPCTNNKLFRGKFEKGVLDGNLNELFNYTFTYKIRPTNVAVHLYHCVDSKSNWIFIQRR
jgi:photoactive yellow protein